VTNDQFGLTKNVTFLLEIYAPGMSGSAVVEGILTLQNAASCILTSNATVMIGHLPVPVSVNLSIRCMPTASR